MNNHQLEPLKKPNNTLNSLQLSLTLLTFLFLTLCLLCSFLYFDGVSRGGGTATWWFGIGQIVGNDGDGCDYFDGKWIWDGGYPLYDAKDCLFVDNGFRCLENGRFDSFFTKWRWQPRHCDLPRFDAKSMLEKLRNKRLVFVGDSIGRNQWESMMCMLSLSIANKSSIYEVNGNPITKHMGSLVFMFGDYNCTIEYFRAPFLVLQGRPPFGSPSNVRTTLRVDKLDWSSGKWRDADVLVFNAGHWWNYEKTIRSGCYFQEGDVVKMNMSIEGAFRRSVETLISWVDNQVNTSKTTVFFRSYAPVHFSGGDWRNGGTCHMETLPNFDIPSFSKTLAHYRIVNDVLSYHTNKSQGSKVNLLDVTRLSLQRRDGHPSLYYLGPKPAPIHRQDCSHWCLPGVPDIWNELLFAVLLKHWSFYSRNATTMASQAKV